MSPFNLIQVVCPLLLLSSFIRVASSPPSPSISSEQQLQSINYTNFNDKSRIMHGEYVQGRKYPYMVSILYVVASWVGNWHPNTVLVCGGSIIHPGLVITAAHCFDNWTDAEILGRFVVYPNYRNSIVPAWDPPENEEYRQICWVEFHPLFIRNVNQIRPYDIAILVLDYPINLAHGFSAINLPDEQYEIGTRLQVPGFGHSEIGEENRLKEVELIRMNDFLCNEYVPGLFHNNLMICANNRARGLTCIGDSGGPVVLKADNPRFDMLIGINGFSFDCEIAAPNDNNYPSYFTNVHHFLPWVNRIIADYLASNLHGNMHGSRDANGVERCKAPPPSPETSKAVQSIRRSNQIFETILLLSSVILQVMILL